MKNDIDIIIIGAPPPDVKLLTMKAQSVPYHRMMLMHKLKQQLNDQLEIVEDTLVIKIRAMERLETSMKKISQCVKQDSNKYRGKKHFTVNKFF